MLVNQSLKGRLQCSCGDDDHKCGLVINKVKSQDEGKWSCLLKLKGSNGEVNTKKKSVHLRIKKDEVEYYDSKEDEVHYYDDDQVYDEYPSYPSQDPSYHPQPQPPHNGDDHGE